MMDLECHRTPNPGFCKDGGQNRRGEVGRVPKGSQGTWMLLCGSPDKVFRWSPKFPCNADRLGVAYVFFSGRMTTLVD